MQAFVNGQLAPEVVVVRGASVAPEGFDARFSATAREYRYVIDTGAVPDPFTARFEWHRPAGAGRGGDAGRGAASGGGARLRVVLPAPGRGEVDRARSAAGHGARATATGSCSAFRANAFLHQMVRALVGTLVRVGEGRLEPDGGRPDPGGARPGGGAAPLAPARGLTLERVVYGAPSWTGY